MIKESYNVKDTSSHGKNICKVYLKFNRTTIEARQCLEFWLSVFKNDNIIIICDLGISQLESIFTQNHHLFQQKIITTNYNLIENYLNLKFSENWSNIANVNLTCWQNCSGQDFWLIDADDTIFLNIDAHEIRNKLRIVENYFYKKNLDGISIDFYREIGVWNHWSFGVAFMKGSIDLNEIKSLSMNKFKEKLKINNDLVLVKNLDGVFDFLRKSQRYKLESFVFNKCYFQHQGYHGEIKNGIYFWDDRKICNKIPLKDDILVI